MPLRGFEQTRKKRMGMGTGKDMDTENGLWWENSSPFNPKRTCNVQGDTEDIVVDTKVPEDSTSGFLLAEGSGRTRAL